MNTCQNRQCNSTRLVEVEAKCNDLCCVQMQGKEHLGYVPEGMGIGGGDMIFFTYCLECGQMQDVWPYDKTVMEEEEEGGDS